ncbi:YggT family protein [Acetivibrio saccincola]|jgi:YggT family protein|uniref:YGGT family protein n=1 Tax=Acetivibrio saccincola TaxID=1677857 RepID=A0A2K9ECI7_9FIRM|nr:YggT family protein [Acetivibrio saccincola]AUG57854.1 YGGT family protein [Acetivibrio saccincola]NLW26789.1 YggT family protein [Acetivibrio saccincola]PQQ67735.1 hypothetical protein B9R14_13920 [Acetivibrio saccincola]HOA97518.1 YggT family protein [Acetivibrio saccincola]
MLHILVRAIILLLDILIMVIAARAISSWLPISKEGAFFRILYQITDPLILPIRKQMQKTSFGQNMTLDFSPAIAILIIYILKNLVLYIL